MIVIIDFTITIMVMINDDDNYFKNNINNNDNNNDTKDQNILGLYLFMVHILHFFSLIVTAIMILFLLSSAFDFTTEVP